MKACTLWALPVVLCLMGCGKDSRYVPVSGRVTMNKQPLANVMVVFQPVAKGDSQVAGSGSSGKTDSDGRFTLKVIADPSKEGAVVGRHKVQIYPPDGLEVKIDPEVGSPDDAPAAKPTIQVPLRYNDATTLTFDVPEAGTDKADFSLTRP